MSLASSRKHILRMDKIVFDDSKYTELPGLSLIGFFTDELYLTNFEGSDYQSEFVYILVAFWSKRSLASRLTLNYSCYFRANLYI